MADSPEVQLDSGHRVALELAYHISSHEEVEPQDREYWLRLYQQCRMVVISGIAAERALEEP